MATTRVASSSRAPPAPRKTPRAAAVKDVTQDEKLAKNLERVLRISRPKEVPSKARRIVAPSKNTKSAATSASAIAANAPPLQRSPAHKAKAKAEQPDESYPWLRVELSPSERAKLAMKTVNECVRSLTIAAQAGFRYNEQEVVEGWTSGKVDSLVDECEAGLRSLRIQDEMGELGKQGIDVDRGALGLVRRCLSLGMYRKALKQLAIGRPRLLRLYTPGVPPRSAVPIPYPAVVAEPHTPPSRNARSAVSQASTSRPSRPTLAGTSKATSKTRPTAPPFPVEWLDLAWLPSPIDGTELDEVVRSVILQALILSWTALLGLENEEAYSALAQHDFSSEKSGDSRLQPLQLALALPQTATTPLLLLLYRHLTAPSLPHTSPHWLTLRLFALQALSITITSAANPEIGLISKHTPAQLWDSARRTLGSHLKGDADDRDRLKDVADAASKITRRVMDMVSRRSEDKANWFVGKEWLSVTEMWIGVGRRLGDSVVIDEALSCMTASTSIDNASALRPALRIPGSTSESSITSAKSVRRAAKLEAEVARLCGDLAKTCTAMSKLIADAAELAEPAAESALRSSDLNAISEALLGLNGDEGGRSVMIQAARAIERVRRSCIKVLARPGNEVKKPGDSTLLVTVQQWLVASVELVEDLLQASALSDTAATSEFVAGAVDSLVRLSRIVSPLASRWPIQQTSLAHLERASQICDLAAPISKPSEVANWLQCLSCAAFAAGREFGREGNCSGALPFLRASSQWTAQALKVDHCDEGSTSLKTMREGLVSKYDLLASCYQKLEDRQAAFQAYNDSIVLHAEVLQDPITVAAASRPVLTVLDPFTGFGNTLSRLSQLILMDPPSFGGHFGSLVKRLPAPIAGLVGERLTLHLTERLFRSEVADMATEIGRGVLAVYTTSEYPVRRLRTIVNMMAVVVVSGLSQDCFDALREEAHGLATLKAIGQDASLATYRRELYGTSLVLSALHAYHALTEPTLDVGSLATQAFHELRQLVIPVTTDLSADETDLKEKRPLGRSTTINAPDRRPPRGTGRTVSESKGRGKEMVGKPVPKLVPEKPKGDSEETTVILFSDLYGLVELLTSLASLLGVLGLTLAKIEALRLIRALLRGRNDYVEEYLTRSSDLGMEYCKLGKASRASLVFLQALKKVLDTKYDVCLPVRIVLHLRHSHYLAVRGEVSEARNEYASAERFSRHILPPQTKTITSRLEKVVQIQRTALARTALAAICTSEGNAAGAITHFSANMRLWTRAADAICRLAPTKQSTEKLATTILQDDPFSAPVKQLAGQDEPSKDDQVASTRATSPFSGKHLYGHQLQIAEGLLQANFDLANMFAQRSSVKECEYFLNQASVIADAVRSSAASSRAAARMAQLKNRMRRYEESTMRLNGALASLTMLEGPDAIDLQSIRGDAFSRQELSEEACSIFAKTSEDIGGLDAIFTAVEALMPSPTKVVSKTMKASLRPRREPVLSSTLTHVLRQQAWLLREAGSIKESDELLSQLKAASLGTSPDDLFLDGRIALSEAINHFKTDLFMSSLTESTIAMPMGIPEKRMNDRQSVRDSIELVLDRSERGFLSAVSLSKGDGRVEDVRQACLSLALLRAFKTSLGHGSPSVTASAASILSSSSSITLERELLEAIDGKFMEVDHEDLKWPSLEPQGLLQSDDPDRSGSPTRHRPGAPLVHAESAEFDEDGEGRLRAYWQSVRAKHASHGYITGEVVDLHTLPADWAVVSMNVTEDHNTIFVSRHQTDHAPIVFCIPLDRQGRREGEDDSFTFDAANAELADIIKSSDESARCALSVEGRGGKAVWWANRKALDKRLEELLSNLEFCWLGAFKTILTPRNVLPPSALVEFGNKLEKIFLEALANGGPDLKKGTRAHLDQALLECFATLSSKCRDEEIEDLLYFILDVYQFHGVPVALAELDIDQIGVDVKGALSELELATINLTPRHSPEHLFLALDKNVAGFPWESIPILRGRSISRIPSLPFLLDQVAMGRHLNPNLVDGRRRVDTRKVFYILTPGNDLARTQAHFEPWISQMVAKAGWKGIVGRPPTELEMIAALRDNDLVLYFGHGGAEQYIRSHKVRHLPKCATTMLWGCSSGLLNDQGDLDRTGTAWNYMVAGCPSLIANLWDVTDRDIDRFAEEVFKKLNLDSAHVPAKSAGPLGMLPISTASTAGAVNASRDACKLKYLTGAAPVVYGIPVYLH